MPEMTEKETEKERIGFVMLNNLFDSVLIKGTTAVSFTFTSFLLCTACSLVLGLVIALCYQHQNRGSKNFVLTLALLPSMIQMVIMLVNGNLGTGVAVMGAFGLVRFRSAPGNAREIGSIFLTMAVGLATGMGYLGVAIFFVIFIELIQYLYMKVGLGEEKQDARTLKITIPEDLDYSEIFDDLFVEFTEGWELLQVRTSNLGSLYKLDYNIILKDRKREKELIDALRCRNGNLEISCGRRESGIGEL